MALGIEELGVAAEKKRAAAAVDTAALAAPGVDRELGVAVEKRGAVAAVDTAPLGALGVVPPRAAVALDEPELGEMAPLPPRRISSTQKWFQATMPRLPWFASSEDPWLLWTAEWKERNAPPRALPWQTF